MPEPEDHPLTVKAAEAFRRAAANVVRLAKQTGTPVLTRVDGVFREVSPYDLPDFEDEPKRPGVEKP